MKDKLYLWIVRLSIIRMSLLKFIFWFKAFPIKILAGIAIEIDKVILNLHGNAKGQDSQNCFEKGQNYGIYIIWFQYLSYSNEESGALV